MKYTQARYVLNKMGMGRKLWYVRFEFIQSDLVDAAKRLPDRSRGASAGLWKKDTEMIRSATEKDFDEIYNVINDAAMAYKGVIPPDRWHEPYMTREELKKQVDEGVRFSCYLDEGKIIGIMGIQDKIDVNLIRHAYVATSYRNRGIGTILLQELVTKSEKPILIGTWKAAHWAIKFYERHGFHLVTEEEKDYLLRRYWNISDRQVETSVVLADEKYRVNVR